MNKTEFVAEVANRAELSKAQAQKVVNAFIDVIAEQMKANEKVSILGFGTFSVSERKARKGINPQNKKVIEIPARKTVKFKAGSALELSEK